MATMVAKIVHRTIERPVAAVYDFAGKPENMPLWASGLASGLEPRGDDWIAHGALGDVTIVFSAPNDFGVLDHIVTLPSGLDVHNALRLVPNGTGTEIIFTLLQRPGMSDRQFADDALWVEKDLNTLKALLEKEENINEQS